MLDSPELRREVLATRRPGKHETCGVCGSRVYSVCQSSTGNEPFRPLVPPIDSGRNLRYRVPGMDNFGLRIARRD
jgi:hypothetical protein